MALSENQIVNIFEESITENIEFSGISDSSIDFWKRNGVLLNPLAPLKKLNSRGFMSWDVETKDGLKGKEMFCYSLAYFDQQEKKVKAYKHRLKNNLDLDELFKRIDNSKDKTHLRVIWVHNLGFDVRFIINYCAEKGIEHKTILSGSQVINLTIDEIGVCFRDSAQFLQSSQEKAEIEYEVPEELRKIDCKDLFEKDFSLWSKKDKKRVVDHNANDVLALHDIMSKFRKNMFEIGKVDILTAYSLASASMKIYRVSLAKSIQNPFLFMKWNKETNRPSYQLDEERHDFVRSTYFGGRCEVFDMNQHKNGVYADKVSMYPAEMYYRNYPVGIPFWINTNNPMLKRNIDKLKQLIAEKPQLIPKELKNPKNLALDELFECKKINEKYYVEREKYSYEGFILAKITPSELKYPILPQRLDKKLMFTNCIRTQVYTLPELRYAFKMGYIIEPIKGLLFSESDDIFTDFVQPLFIEKSHSTGGKRKASKIALNSCYGKFGQSYHRKAPLVHYFKSEKEQFEFIQDHPDMKNFKAVHNKNSNLWIVYEIIENTMMKPFMNVSISSYITAYSRIELHKQLQFCEDNNIEVYYCDSDSITVAQENMKLIKLGKKLGNWDIEQTFEKVKFMAPKSYLAIQDGKPFLKMKGINKFKIDEIKATSKTMKDIEKKIREPIKLAERYLTYKESVRGGIILASKILTKHYSFENFKRNFTNGKSIPWNDTTLPSKFRPKITA